MGVSHKFTNKGIQICINFSNLDVEIHAGARRSRVSRMEFKTMKIEQTREQNTGRIKALSCRFEYRE